MARSGGGISLEVEACRPEKKLAPMKLMPQETRECQRGSDKGRGWKVGTTVWELCSTASRARKYMHFCVFSNTGSNPRSSLFLVKVDVVT